ncbi:glycosyltransferase [Domibacillus sp. A3M-37]|uniref:glycosyltransferase n=1 Tax=Domibacillus sp. A3M-37 TaxID=2962037 RepID=UPI0020B66522|nr:glycosyltransferase [Domibacillus sp. A3M-37]MCP3761401.1 glycosyltransferase [Domibacillus sp. A3M-37]
MNTKVSIIVPVYNTEKYLEKCLTTICEQTLKEIEIIVVNDGSKDNSYKIIEKFAEKDPRIKIVVKENGGLSSARNEGLKFVSSKWVCFIDSDDYIEEDMIKTLYDLVENNKANMGVCGCKDIYPTKEVVTSNRLKDEIIELDDGDICGFLVGKRKDLTIVVWNKIYNMDIINKYNIKFESNKEIFSEDLLFNLYYMVHCTKIVSASAPLYNYLIRTGSIMNSRKKNLLFKFENLLEKYKEYCLNMNKGQVLKNFLPILTVDLLNISFRDTSLKERNLNNIVHDLIFCRQSKIIRGSLSGLYNNKHASIKYKLLSVLYSKLDYRLASLVIFKYFNGK